MTPIPRVVQTGQAEDWYPNLEMPSQFNTLEVLMADARRMIFPKGREWFTVSSYLSDEYIKRFETRRESVPLIGEDAVPMILDQESADTLVKAVFDHYHSLYNFRSLHDLCMAEEFKYGTSIAAVREAVIPKYDISSRGAFAKELKGPALVPYSIKNTYLDESPLAMMHEGFVTSGTTIRRSYKRIDDIKRAMAAESRGWRKNSVNNLDELNGKDDKRGHVEVLISEGDHLFEDGTFLPDTRVTVAVGSSNHEVIRYEDNVKCEVIVGHYLREHVDSSYGTSPLMKGQPLQEALSEGINRMMASVALDAEPPVLYDRNDAAIAASGGADLSPGSQHGVEDMDAVRALDIANPEAHAVVVQFLKKFYEEVTGVNDPRRGAEVKSHTTATANDIQESRGQMRTADYVEDRQQGPLTSMLYKEFDIIKRVLKKPQPMPLGKLGIEGWVQIASDDLPDRIAVNVLGAIGPIEERQQIEVAVGAINQIIQIHGIAMQMGIPVPELKIEDIDKFILNRAGIQDASRVIGETPSGDSGVPIEEPGGVTAGAEVLPEGAIPGLAPGQG